eukprot:scaffold46688_cov19-Tisochrysis_lutea.AAC.1
MDMPCHIVAKRSFLRSDQPFLATTLEQPQAQVRLLSWRQQCALPHQARHDPPTHPLCCQDRARLRPERLLQSQFLTVLQHVATAAGRQ